MVRSCLCIRHGLKIVCGRESLLFTSIYGQYRRRWLVMMMMMVHQAQPECNPIRAPDTGPFQRSAKSMTNTAAGCHGFIKSVRLFLISQCAILSVCVSLKRRYHHCGRLTDYISTSIVCVCVAASVISWCNTYYMLCPRYCRQ